MTEVTIEALGRAGDGVAAVAGQVRHLPFTLPGERVRVEADGATAVVQPSPQRVEPICRHFGICGGCQLQHLAPEPYQDWKRSLLVSALAREGIEAPVGALLAFGPHARRRVVFSAIKAEDGIRLGFTRRAENRIVAIGECPVLLPAIERRLPLLRAVATILATRRGVMKLGVLLCANGLDIAVETGSAPGEAARRHLIGLIGGGDGLSPPVIRLAVDGETIIELDRPVLQAGPALVTPPPGAFAQAVAEAEDAMVRLASGHLAGCRRIADLYAGFGAFALALAEHAPVLAAEVRPVALAALDRAWRETGGRLKSITTLARDLDRSPLVRSELKRFDGVVIDPPRAGAEGQMREIAGSAVRRVVAVSCNPVTLARDLRILLDGGFRIASITPIDQFVFTPHLEAVALLER